ncbi:MAG: DUF1284 domain-containing protein [Candidatus Bathyarchaeia archaeon]
MLNLRAHHLLCLMIPDERSFRSKARETFRERGYVDEYIDAYMRVFDAARTNSDEVIRVLDSPRGDDTCIHCANYRGDICASPHAEVFTEWDREILTLFGLRVGENIKVLDLHRLVREKIDPANMPGVCRCCIFDLLEECRENLSRLKPKR